MQELIVAEFISLDGVIQAPDGAEEETDGGFLHGGWTLLYWHDEIEKYFDFTLVEASPLTTGVVYLRYRHHT